MGSPEQGPGRRASGTLGTQGNGLGGHGRGAQWLWQPTGWVGENHCTMLLGDASCGALHEKGTDGDERANELPSSYQNGDEPYPWGTWARQRVLSRVCDMWTGTGNEWAGSHRCQT